MDAWRLPDLAFTAQRRERLLALIVLPVLMLALISCVRRKDEPVFLLGSEGETMTGQATLYCGDQCRGSSQCGQIDTDWVVLASSSGPALESHDLTFPDQATVTIITSERRAVQSVSDPSQSDLQLFYAIDVPDLGSGWVAGWCIGQQIVP